jgi:hypothetical protein
MEADLTGAIWQRASGEPGEPCVEIAFLPAPQEGGDQVIAMRDSGNPQGPVLIFTPGEWRAFTAGVRDGEFDLS